MVEGGMKCVKYLLFVFNLIFLLAGIGLIASGAYVYVELHKYYDFFGNDYMGPGILLIVVGVIIVLLSFFGCCGAHRENYCLTMTFAILLGLIFILELAGGIAGFALRNDIEDDVDKTLRKAEKNYGVHGHDGVTKTWDKLQQDFKCCGVDNANEWRNHTETAQRPPKSCCENEGNCTYDTTYDKGCKNAFEDWLKDKIAIVGGVGIGLAFIQIVGILFACCLARAIRKEYEVV